MVRRSESGYIGSGNECRGGTYITIDDLRPFGDESVEILVTDELIYLAGTKLEMEVIGHCGSGGLDDYKPSRTNLARMKLEGQLDVLEYSRITVPDSVHVGDPAGGYVEMLKARNSARGQLMFWNEKQAMTEKSNLNWREYGLVMSLKANEIGLKKLLEISWRAALQRLFDETMHAPATVAAYLAYPCARTHLQVRLA